MAAAYGVGGSDALARLVAAELAPANLLAGTAVCVAPILSLGAEVKARRGRR